MFLGIHLGGIDWQLGDWAFGCDFHGNDMSNVQTSGELCGGNCASSPGCTHFTWTTLNGGTCWKKSGKVSKNDAYETGDKSMVCGIVGGSPDKRDGKTTRYWDCCKPSCSWPGKVSGSNAVVQSCSKNGYAAIDPNAGSGCGGGPAFTCNDQQPWAVNNNMAYGFAAATIPGMIETQRCCACFQLDFTSGPIAGKSMIVQVTNSGDDVSHNQFDLQIPGGGVGIFNGCAPQWNAPPNGWGERYGGVTSRKECDALPNEIRAGCYFRFDWFQGADNPTMKYYRVKCPSELVAKSKCSRSD